VNRYKPIFLKYSVVFFLVVFGLLSFGQYHDIGKLDLKFSLPLALLLGVFGGVIAAIFVGGFKKLEESPPTIQQSQYLEVDEAILNSKLAKVRRSRRLVFAAFAFWPVYGVAISELGLPEYFIFAYMAAFLFFGGNLSYVKCPRCGYPFFSREAPGTFFTGRYHNIFSSKCMNCELSLKSK
jgi:hypothetical protein